MKAYLLFFVKRLLKIAIKLFMEVQRAIITYLRISTTSIIRTSKDQEKVRIIGFALANLHVNTYLFIYMTYLYY